MGSGFRFVFVFFVFDAGADLLAPPLVDGGRPHLLVRLLFYRVLLDQKPSSSSSLGQENNDRYFDANNKKRRGPTFEITSSVSQVGPRTRLERCESPPMETVCRGIEGGSEYRLVELINDCFLLGLGVGRPSTAARLVIYKLDCLLHLRTLWMTKKNNFPGGLYWVFPQHFISHRGSKLFPSRHFISGSV